MRGGKYLRIYFRPCPYRSIVLGFDSSTIDYFPIRIKTKPTEGLGPLAIIQPKYLRKYTLSRQFSTFDLDD